MKKKANIYIPTKTAMQSGRGKLKDWILEFETRDSQINVLMGWESSDDTLKEVRLKFSSKEKAIEYAEFNNIDYRVFEPKQKEFVIKSYADNFTKN
ncbi:ETC complex I subunit [Pelagibacteraceae bacterium]|nr:ETC complex I subunit [Pelagibacteraceae bacterium]